MKLKEEQVRILRVLSKENAARILLSIVEHKARSPSQLAVDLNLQPVQVHRVLEDLSKAELITRQEGNPTPLRAWVFYRPTAKGKQAALLLT